MFLKPIPRLYDNFADRPRGGPFVPDTERDAPRFMSAQQIHGLAHWPTADHTGTGPLHWRQSAMLRVRPTDPLLVYCSPLANGCPRGLLLATHSREYYCSTGIVQIHRRHRYAYRSAKTLERAGYAKT